MSRSSTLETKLRGKRCFRKFDGKRDSSPKALRSTPPEGNAGCKVTPGTNCASAAGARLDRWDAARAGVRLGKETHFLHPSHRSCGGCHRSRRPGWRFFFHDTATTE